MSRSLRKNEISSKEHIEIFSKYVRETEHGHKEVLLRSENFGLRTLGKRILQSARKTGSYQTAKETEEFLGDWVEVGAEMPRVFGRELDM